MGGGGEGLRGGGCRAKTKVFDPFLSVEMCQCCHSWVQWVFIAQWFYAVTLYVSVTRYVSCG